MRIDIEYLKNLLNQFLEAESAHISVLKLHAAGFPVESSEKPGYLDEKFLFHIQIVMDNGLISDKNLRLAGLESIGIHLDLSGTPTLVEKDIRLTQRGHDFANALSKKEVFEKLKNEFKDAPFKVIFDGSQKLVQHFFQKKLDNLLDE